MAESIVGNKNRSWARKIAHFEFREFSMGKVNSGQEKLIVGEEIVSGHELGDLVGELVGG